jgi:hypothetical protein
MGWPCFTGAQLVASMSLVLDDCKLGTQNVWAKHVAAILGRRRCEFSHHRNPRISDDHGSAGCASHGHEAAIALLVGFDSSDDPDHLGSDGCACNRSIRLGFGVLDVRCGARGVQSRIFCVRELRDAGLCRRAAGRTLAVAWPSNRDERHVAIWMVDRSHFRGLTANVGTHPRYQWLAKVCLLLGVKRTSTGGNLTSAVDPKRTRVGDECPFRGPRLNVVLDIACLIQPLPKGSQHRDIALSRRLDLETNDYLERIELSSQETR